MDLTTLTDFFMWCLIINSSIMLISVFLVVPLADLVFKVHSSMFNITRESYNNMIYGYLALFKIFIIVFNLTPYLALTALNS
ncbi:MAG: DUF6868 family protein [Bdellovibrionales bacterium]